jgi:polyisoprenoid-binding protein YceI
MGTKVMGAATQRGLALAKFAIDPGASRFTVQAFATGLLSSFGHNPTIGIRDFDGEIECDPGTYQNARLRLSLRTRSMDVLDEMKRDDREKLEQEMYGKVLEADRFLTATFESKEITIQKLGDDLFMAHVKGELQFHGTSHDHNFDARVTRMGTILRISGQFPLKQSDYGIKPFSFAGGALKLKDELKFGFELVARKEE